MADEESSISLREFFERLLEEREKHFEQIKRSHEEAFKAWVAAHTDMHSRMDTTAVATAIQLDKRLAGMNELREQIYQERSMYLTREAYDARHDAVLVRVSVLETERARFDGKWIVLGAVGLLLAQYVLTHAGAIFGKN